MVEYVREGISGDVDYYFSSFVCKAVRATQCDQKQRLLLAKIPGKATFWKKFQTILLVTLSAVTKAEQIKKLEEKWNLVEKEKEIKTCMPIKFLAIPQMSFAGDAGPTLVKDERRNPLALSLPAFWLR